MATPAAKTRAWRANLRNELGEDNYLQRQRDQKRAYRARKKLEQAQAQAQAQAQQAPQPPPRPATRPSTEVVKQLLNKYKTPPRPATRPSTEVIKQLLSKSNNPPPIPPKSIPGAAKKLQLLLKQLNIQKSNKND